MHLTHLRYENCGRWVEKKKKKKKEEQEKKKKKKKVKVLGDEYSESGYIITKKLIEISAVKPGYLSGKGKLWTG
jgi:N-acetyl-anhydromuramyl-L-alanine amidase AmpD